MEKAGDMFGLMPVSTKLPDGIGLSLDGTKEITSIFHGKVFSFPKTTSLIRFLVEISTKVDKDAVILDFFSGSATTAHAVMQLNAEDGGHRKFIMVQLPEPCGEKTEAFKAGYKNICEIGKERIRRAGDQIKADNPLGTQDLDIGFRVFRVDSSNMKDVYYHPEELDQQSVFDLVSNIKDDRTDLDLLYACLLDWVWSSTYPIPAPTWAAAPSTMWTTAPSWPASAPMCPALWWSIWQSNSPSAPSSGTAPSLPTTPRSM